MFIWVIQVNLETLSLDEKMGQRFIIGTNSNKIDIIVRLIKERHIGGVILYRRNYETYKDMIKIVKRLKEANNDNKLPLFIAIDQEGGVVNRIPEEVHNLINISDLSKNRPELVKKYADTIGEVLISTGVNMDFAPVVDIYNNSKSKALYKRCFYGDDEKVARDAREYITKMQNRGVIPVIKHFPGHGATTKDSHFLLPYVMNYKRVMDYHMVPFSKLTDVAPAMMIGHMRISRLSTPLPASMNNEFIGSFLERAKYNGLIISDEINMLKRQPAYRFIYLDRFLKSINDIILVKIKDIESGYKIFDKYRKILTSDNKYIEQLNNSILKIMKTKEKYNINDSTDFNGVNIQEINNKIDDINREVSEG